MRIFLMAGLILCALAPDCLAQEPISREDKSFTFEMRGKPWGTVFEWLVDKTGRPFISRDIPTGTFNFIAKQGQQFTIPQVIDIINDGLYPLKYVLINKGTSFTLLPADKEIDQVYLPRVAPEDLVNHGQTEIVSTIVKLKSLLAEDLAPEVKKQLGPFGKVVPLTSVNQLLVQDNVVNLQRIIATIQDKQNPLTLELIPLAVLDAPRVAETLKAVFPNLKNLAPYIEADAGRNAILIKGTADQVADVKAAIRSIGENNQTGTIRIISLDKGNGPALAEALQRLLLQVRPETPIRINVPNGKGN